MRRIRKLRNGTEIRSIQELRDLARTHTRGMLEVLTDIANDPDESGRARVAAATAVLDRAWGKVGSDEADDRNELRITLRQIVDHRSKGMYPGAGQVIEHLPDAVVRNGGGVNGSD